MQFYTGSLLSDWILLSQPSYDIDKEGDNILVHLNIPGVKKEAIKAELAEDERDSYRLSVTWEKKGTPYKKVFTIPPQYDTENLGLTYEDGVLTILIPLSPKAKPREIPIK